MTDLNLVLRSDESTVVAEYEPQKQRSDAYQSEAALESAFIKMLSEQGYEYVSIKSEADLIANLRAQLEKLNGITFTDAEWADFFKNNICDAKQQDSAGKIVAKTEKIQNDAVQSFVRADGRTQNVTLIDKKNIHNNRLQVINQYVETQGNHDTRYDVTILVNGLPLVHVELKRRGVPLKEAFNQIDRYQRDSFWAGCGLYEYVQIFVISNGTNTKYYSNSTRFNRIKELSDSRRGRKKKTSDSFEFTSFWADANNKIIPDLVDFTKTFFARHTLLNILTRYCVFTSEKLLLVMRPYQIAATEKILNKIQIATNYHKEGSLDAGGYVWHTTGSGKTLTSFKTAQLAANLPFIDKVLFVVDRKDLDYQTIREYDRFEKGAANGNNNTEILRRQLENKDKNDKPKDYRIIVTTIQKLDNFIRKYPDHPIYNRHLVIVFDECHRSQFGDMHARIVKKFKRYHLFGFTGTPIFAQNAGTGGAPDLRTTAQAFGDKLHTYTIVNAINDGNVLPFRIDYIGTVKAKDGTKDKLVSAIDTQSVLAADERVSLVVGYILEHFDQKTKRNVRFDLKGKRVNGFNSIFAVSDIPVCKKYYLEFKKQLAEKSKKLTVATIFSFAPNEEDPCGLLAEEEFETQDLDQTSRDFLDGAIDDYNKKFKTNFDTSARGFQDYYKDVSERVKNREIDILLVVNMFLTGFDATTLNTLWVDKNLKMHGLIQAFSRTNRILNSVKSYGNIVCFRDLSDATDEAIALFGDSKAGGLVLLKSYDDYFHGYDDDNGKHHRGYRECVDELLERFPLGAPVLGEENEKDFIRLFGNILRLRNILTAFDDFAAQDLIKPLDLQDYTGRYYDLHEKYKRTNGDRENILDDVVFEMELVKQVEVNIDYILDLVAKYHQSHCKNKEILGAIDKAVGASPELRSKKELIDGFISTINADSNVLSDWNEYVKRQKEKDVLELIETERLKPEETRKFLKNAFADGALKTTGTAIDEILPPMSLFNPATAEKKANIIEKLKVFFNKYFGIAQD